MKNTTIKKFLSLFLALAIIICALPFGAFTFTASAENVTSGTTGDCTWTLNGTTLTLSGDGYMKDYLDDSPYDYAPWGTEITKVIIKDGVKNIGSCAFFNCTKLRNISIPDSVTKISAYDFDDTAYYNNESNWENGILYIGKHLIIAKRSVSGSYTIKSGTKVIADSAFYSCGGLTGIILPNSVTHIGDYSFFRCGLADIAIPKSVVSIGDYAFQECTKLESISLPDTITSIGTSAFWWTAYYKDAANWENGILYIGEYLIKAETSISNSCTIKTGTKVIADSAFYSCDGLTGIILPNSVIRISDSAFYNCTNLTSVSLPDSVKSIDNSAFFNCTSLTNITIPNSVTSIGSMAFALCKGLKSVTIGKGITEITRGMFLGCTSLNSIAVPDSVTVISSSAFSDCYSLEKVELGKKVKSIGGSAFYNCSNLTSIIVPDSVKSMGDSVFNYCTKLTSIVLSNNISKIPDYAFASCYNLESIIIPNGVTTIGKQAFIYCENLKNITIPSSVTSLGANAFYDCNNIENVYYCGSEENKRAVNAPYGWNGEIYNSKWHYNSCVEKTNHTYSNACDTNCNDCNAKRTIKHTYSNSCDTTCNACKATRKIYHTYTNDCDKTCNVCKATRTVPAHKYKTTTTKATISKNGNIVKKCTVCKKVASTTTIKHAKTFKLSTTSYTYNGKVNTPSVVVKDSAGKTLKKNTDYTVTYSSGRKNVGTYKVTIKMKGNYTGTKTLTFKINPAGTKVSKLTAGKKSITVNIAKKSTQVTGYQVQYSTSKSFSKTTTKTISSYKTTKYTLKSFSAKKTYYVRIRTYKTVNGKKYYSTWSTAKSVKTK